MPDNDIGASLRLLERPVEPPPGLADAIFQRLMAELETESVPTAPPAAGRPPLRTPMIHRHRRRIVLTAAALAAASALIAGLLVVTLPHPRSAFAVVRDARTKFTHLPPLHVVLERVVSTRQLRPELHRNAPDWVQVIAIDYQDPAHSRITILSDRNDPFQGNQTGAFTVFNPRFEGAYDPATRIFAVTPASEVPAGLAKNTALLYLSPEFQQGPRLTDQAIRTGCTRVADATVAGRQAEHISCRISPIPREGIFPGATAQVYLDKLTGAVLKTSFPNGGLVRVRSIDYGSAFDAGTFATSRPKGSHIAWNGSGPPPPRFRVTGLSSAVTAVVPVGNQPDNLAAGAGALWAATGSGWIARVDPRTLAVTRIRMPIATVRSVEGYSCGTCRLVRRQTNGLQVWRIAQPGTVVAGGGSVWVTDCCDNTVQRLDPGTNRFAAAPIVIHLPVEHHHCDGWPAGEHGCYLLTGRMTWGIGAVWMVSWSGGGWFLGGNACCDSAILRIDPATGRIRSTPLPGMAYDLVDLGGVVWVSGTTQPASAADWGSPVIWKVDPSSGRVLATIPCGNPGCNSLAAGDGSIWFTNDDPRPGHGIVGRVSAASGRVAVRLRACREPNGIAVAGGAVWVACTGDNRVVQIDPRSNRVVRSFRTGGQPVSVVALAGSAWVTNSADGTLVRVPLG